MKKLICVLAAGVIFVGAALGQSKVTGFVRDENRAPVNGATISLLKAADSALVRMSVSDKSGSFEIDIALPGSYRVLVSAVGYANYYSALFETKNGSTVRLDDAVVLGSSRELTAVTVSGRKPLIEQRIDRTVVNVDAAVTNVGATALEVLEKSPGITVDKDGNISLKGKQGVQVFIDGKPSYLSGQELVNLLSNMNANQLDQIEIMTNPPAKYDAAGNSGIINIKTKKNKARGFNGSATAGYSQGVYSRTNESINLNYRNNKVNVFTNYSFSKNNSYQELTINRIYRKEDNSVDAIFDQVAFMPRNNTNNNLKLGADYFINKKVTLGIVTTGFIDVEKFRNFNTVYLKNANAAVDSIVNSSGSTKNTWKNGTVNLNFRYQFDSTGRELTADVDYSTYSSANSQVFMNTSYDPAWFKKSQTDLTGDLPVTIDIYSIKADYSHPLKKDFKVDAGVKSSYVSTDNAANYFNLVNGTPEPDYSKTNTFQYKENINAAYMNFNRQLKKWGIQAGVRFENTNYKGHQLGNVQKPDSAFSKTYNSAFPTLYVTYAASEKHQFSANIGRRIDRPSYEDLNPFLFYLDNYTYQAGNPFLRPQYSTNVELAHTYGGFLTTTVNYSRTKNFFTETFEQQDFATIERQGNIGIRENAGISVSAQVEVAKWWSTSLYGNYNYNRFSGILYGEQIHVSASNVLFNVNNQYKFNNGWSAELSGFYRSRGVEGQIVLQPFGQVSAGVSKSVIKGKGSIRLNVRDMFLTQIVKGSIDFQRTEAHFINKRDSRVAGISFTYRFGKPIKGPQNDRQKGGAADEQNRVKINN